MGNNFWIINLISFINTKNRLLTLVEKIFNKFNARSLNINKKKLKNWLLANSTDLNDLLISWDKELFGETVIISKKIKKEANIILSNIDLSLGGGGAYPLLYFLTRKLKPNNILETGVAVGYSSYAFLLGIEKNGMGTLYSSDFPYFRIKHPEKYIGILVPKKLKSNWNLFLDGDRINFGKIKKFDIEKFDLIHYDSDKTYKGRDLLLSEFNNYLTKDTIIIFDDIQDNYHFYDLVINKKVKDWGVFSFENKYLGVIGLKY
jgi:predicted O-methyltransferase YrrM